MIATIQSVEPNPRPWIKDGILKAHFVTGTLREGGEFGVYVAAKSADAAKEMSEAMVQRDLVAALIGQTQELGLERRGETPKGAPKFALKSYPGMPARQFGGGGKSFTPRYRDTAEGFAQEQASIHRSVALTQAVAYVATLGSVVGSDVLQWSDRFYEWLSRK